MSEVPEAPHPAEVPTRGRIARDITDAVVRVTRDAIGRGPVSTRVIIDGEAVVVLMHDTLTKAEQSLVDGGRVAEVLALRRAFQDLLRPASIEAVEHATGRKVQTFMSTNHADPDHAAEIFLLDGPLAGHG
ncbi:unannotated protein [freshwater metagenome]|uniref:Unannotated protein n=1 Tax=freshwater metagenome TaxID=449393 RepID=A0A6J7FT01_9ZZZZ